MEQTTLLHENRQEQQQRSAMQPQEYESEPQQLAAQPPPLQFPLPYLHPPHSFSQQQYESFPQQFPSGSFPSPQLPNSFQSLTSVQLPMPWAMGHHLHNHATLAMPWRSTPSMTTGWPNVPLHHVTPTSYIPSVAASHLNPHVFPLNYHPSPQSAHPFTPQAHHSSNVSSAGFSAFPMQPSLVAPLPRSTNAATPVVAPTKPSVVLAAQPCQPPSPFATSHYVVAQAITLVKGPNDASFGIKLQLDMASALVEQSPPNVLTAPPQAPPAAPRPIYHTTESSMSPHINGTDTPKVLKLAKQALHPSPASTACLVSVVPPAVDALNAAPAVVMTLPKPRRPRRRRVPFSVVTVLDPSEQNQRTVFPVADATLTTGSSTIPVMRLQQRDILLTIAGRSTAGLTFVAACRLFSEHSTKGEDGITRCDVTVARAYVAVSDPIVKKLKATTTLKLGSSVPNTHVAPLEPLELLALSMARVMAVSDPRRVMGEPLKKSAVSKFFAEQPLLVSRCSSDLTLQLLHSKYTTLCQDVDSVAQQKAIRHWKLQWSLEPEQIQAISGQTKKRSYWTDAQRAVARATPKRKPNQCRCSSKEHEHVNDINCPLYSNLRKYLDGKSMKDEGTETAMDDSVLTAVVLSSAVPAAQRTVRQRLATRDMNVVEKAFTKRVVRTQVESKADAAEAQFVALMESIQLTQCNQAHAAPSLAVMVLSTVMELQSDYCKDGALSPWSWVAPSVCVAPDANPSRLCQSVCPELARQEEEDDDDDDDDDDVPLAMLGKRVRADEMSTGLKDGTTLNVATGTSVRPHFLAKVLQLLSQKWGHVFREASHENYAWHWEVHHGQVSESGSPWNTYTNPRTPRGLSLENVRFIVTDPIVSQLQQFENSPGSTGYIEALTILGHMLAPNRTGVMDELDAFINTKVLSVDERGIPVLSKDWWKHVDILLLDEMSAQWGVDADTMGRCGVADQLRKTLYRKWTASELGWALNSNVEDIIYEYEEFDEWRRAFTDKITARADNVEGIGRFR